MKLTDIGKVTSKTLNEALQENAGWSIKLDKLTVRSARNMMESIDQKLSTVKKSSRIHTSERDPNYVNMLMAKNVLETFVRESKKAKPDFLDVDKDGDTKEPMKQALKQKKTVPAKKIEEAKKVKEPGAVATAQVMKMGGSYVTKDGKHLTKKGIEKRDEIIKAIEKDNKKKKQVKESATFSARRRLLEDELSQAQSMLAAKDMVDSIQDMIEELSRMQNEQLPPLADSIRASFGATEADTFKNSATSSLQSLLSNLQSARDGMDQAVRVLAGEPAEMPDTGSELDIESPGGDEFSATEPAKGGELPMGREKRR